MANATWQDTGETTFINDYGYRTLIIDRNGLGLDEPSLREYIAECLADAANRGEKYVNIFLQRVPTDVSS